MPLELWMLFSYPILGTSPLDARLIYLRTMLVAMESLRTGVTSVSDDVYEAPRQDIDRMDAVFQAYRDIGIRVVFSPMVWDVPPIAMVRDQDRLPDDVREMLGTSGDVQYEPMVGYRKSFGADGDVSGLVVVHGTHASAEKNGASYEATRIGGDTGATPT